MEAAFGYKSFLGMGKGKGGRVNGDSPPPSSWVCSIDPILQAGVKDMPKGGARWAFGREFTFSCVPRGKERSGSQAIKLIMMKKKTGW